MLPLCGALLDGTDELCTSLVTSLPADPAPTLLVPTVEDRPTTALPPSETETSELPTAEAAELVPLVEGAALPIFADALRFFLVVLIRFAVSICVSEIIHRRKIMKNQTTVNLPVLVFELESIIVAITVASMLRPETISSLAF